MPVSAPLPYEFSPSVCLGNASLCNLPLRFGTAICAIFFWACDVLAAQDGSAFCANSPVLLAAFACPWCDCASLSESCCIYLNDYPACLHAISLVHFKTLSLPWNSAPCPVSLNESIQGFAMCLCYAFVFILIPLQMHRWTRFYTPTTCAAASKCKKLTRCVVGLTVVMITGHITIAGHITGDMTVYIMIAGDDIGMVLSPQCFHNLNLHEDIFNHSNIHFWEYMQPGYDALGFISCTGETSPT
jgi:hypothetical protein